MQHDPIVVGAIAAVMTAGNTLLLGLPVSPRLVAAAWAGAALVYWADRTLGFSPEDQHAHPDRVDWIRQNRRWIYVESIALAGVLTATVPFLTAETLAVAAVCAGLGVVHVIPVLPGRRRMKAIGRGRAVTIALAWSVGSVVLPWVEGGGAGAEAVASGLIVSGLLVAQALLVYANVVVAGWADRQGDERAGVPVTVGENGANVRRRAVGSAAAGGGVLLLLGATTLPAMPAIGYVAGVAFFVLLLAQLRPREVPRHMLWLDLAVALPGALVILLN